MNPDIWIVAFTIALVASLETLLCVEATDKLDPNKNVTPTNRELLAQGTGNIVSGMIGGLPITQVIVRSSANIQSGGRSKMSAIIHGIFIAHFGAFDSEIIEYDSFVRTSSSPFNCRLQIGQTGIIQENV